VQQKFPELVDNDSEENKINDRDSKKDYKRLSTIMLTTEEWDLIRDLLPILNPFAEATEILGGSNYCTHSIMIPILIDIKKRFHPTTSRGILAARKIIFDNDEVSFDEEIAIEDDEQPPPVNATRKIRISEPVNCNGLIEKIKLHLFVAIDHYWDDLTSPDILLPSLLDPRMKDLNFVTITERQATENLLREKYEELKSQDQNNNSNVSSPSTNVDESKGKKVFTVFANLKKKVSPADDEI
ncbi:19860_t:CDS:2, partial [Funneliformis geosporum]